MKKKLLCGLLMAIMLLTLLPATVLAADEPDTSWYIGHESETEFTITTPAQLAGLAVICNENRNASPFAGKTVRLGADIDLTGYTWTPIWWNAGTFDGQGHAITALNVTRGVSGTTASDESGLFIGLFAYTGNNSMLCNFTVSGKVELTDLNAEFIYAGGVVGFNCATTIINVGSAVDVSITGKNAKNADAGTNIYAGGIAGYNSGTTDETKGILNSYVTGKISASGYSVILSGIAGYNNRIAIINCFYGGSELKVYNSNYSTIGIIAYDKSGTTSNCYNTYYPFYIDFEIDTYIATSAELLTKLNDADVRQKIITDHGVMPLRWKMGTGDMPVHAFQPDEQFTDLTPGETYWFDLSAQDIPGKVNATLPDSTLHYVPFTYAGTITAYVLNQNSNGIAVSSEAAAVAITPDAQYGYCYDHSLFVADNIVTYASGVIINEACVGSWISLNDANLIFGRDYESDGVRYTLRAPSAGSDSNYKDGDAERGLPLTNEWDTILDKSSEYIKHGNDVASSGQETCNRDVYNRVLRGYYHSTRSWSANRLFLMNFFDGYRPVLEVPGDLTSDELKPVTLVLNGGSVGSETSINIVVRKDVEYTAPDGMGLTAPAGKHLYLWLGDNGVTYNPGASVPATVTTLTAQWADGIAVGDFVVKGGEKNKDYSFSYGVLTVETATPLTISMRPGVEKTCTNRIAVDSGVKADITLAGVNIETDANKDKGISPISFVNAGDSSLTLAAGTENLLVAKNQSPGVRYSGKLTIGGGGELEARAGERWPGIGGDNVTGRWLVIDGGVINAYGGGGASGIGGGNKDDGGTIVINNGVINAYGGEPVDDSIGGGAGIGGGNNGSAGTITINGGTVNAYGGSGGAGIGGGNKGSAGTITISGGTIHASVGTDNVYGFSGGADIGSGRKGSVGIFSTGESGSAVIYAKTITDINTRDNLQKQSNWSGIFFNENTGVVYGNVTLTEDLTVSRSQKLNIPYGRSLTIKEGVTLTNNGVVSNYGTLNNNGYIAGNNAVTGIGVFNGVPGATSGSADNIYTDNRDNKVLVLPGCFAKEVVSFTPGTSWTNDYLDTYPPEILGAPDRGANSNGMAITLGTKGSIVLLFEEEIIDGDGTDIYVFEVGKTVEPVSVYISPNGSDWYYCGETDDNHNGVDIKGAKDTDNNPAPEGCKYVRITDKNSTVVNYPGADVDAVAINIALDTPVVTLNQSQNIPVAKEGDVIELTMNVSGITPVSDVKWTISKTDANGILTLPEKTSDNLAKNIALSLGSFTIAENADGQPLKTATVHITFSGSADYISLPEAIDVNFILAAGTGFTVTYDLQGHGTPVDTVTDIVTGTKITEPEYPAETGYSFRGWYKDSDCTKKWDFDNDTVIKPIILYALWLSTDAGVTEVSVNGTAGSINGKNISVVLPYGSVSVVPSNKDAVSITTAVGATVTKEQTTSDGGKTWTFTVTAEDGETENDYTVSVTIAPDPAAGNKADIAAAKSAIDNLNWTVAQSTANTTDAVRAWIENQLSAMNLNGVSYTVDMTDFTAAIAGSYDDRDGTNGGFGFTVSLTKGTGVTFAYGSATVTNGVITASPYLTYSVTSGAAAVWRGYGDLSFTVDAPHGKFIGIMIDGEQVYGGYNTEASDGTLLTLNQNYLYSLTNQSHTLRVNFTDGCAETRFTISYIPIPLSYYSPVAANVAYTVTALAGEGGGVSPDGAVSVREGHDITFIITPDDGYVISDVLADGISVIGKLSDSGYTFENVRKPHNLLAIFAKKSAETAPTVLPSAAENPFTDVTDDDWFFEDVMFVYENKLMQGIDASLFSPSLTANRGMLVTVLYRLEGEPAVTGACPFGDVTPGSYCENAITWAASVSIADGYGDGNFGPDDLITREQLAAMLYRYAAYRKYGLTKTADLTAFSDHAQISSYAEIPLAWANTAGLVTGKGDGILDPTGNALRCEVAALLHRFCENFMQ